MGIVYSPNIQRILMKQLVKTTNICRTPITPITDGCNSTRLMSLQFNFINQIQSPNAIKASIKPFSTCFTSNSNNLWFYMHKVAGNIKTIKPCHYYNSSCVRRFATHRKSPFDVDVKTLADTLVFSNSNYNNFKLNFFGLVFFGLFAQFSVSIYNINNTGETHQESKDNPYPDVVPFALKYKYAIVIFFTVLAFASLTMACIIPQRIVHKLTLLQGGQKLKVSTFTHTAIKKDFVVPLDHISFSRSRKTSSDDLNMKVKDRWLYFAIRKNDGTFHDTFLFDHVIALNRKL